MSESKKNANTKLAQVKIALAEKCERLANVSNSTPRKKVLLNQAARHRRMAADLARK